MFKKTLGLIALLLLIIVGEGVWISRLDLASIWSSRISEVMQSAGTDSLSDSFSSLEDSSNAESAIAAPLATLGDAKGFVTIWRDDEPTIVSPFMTLYDGDQIETGVDGKAEIAWTGYGRTLLAPNTKLTIVAADYTEKGDGIVANLKLETGRIWTRLEQLLTTGSSFDVKASNVVATVRGTSFGMGLDKPGMVEVKVTDSTVDVGLTQTPDSDEIIGSIMKVDAMERLEILDGAGSLTKPLSMSKLDLDNDPFMVEGNASVPKEYLDTEWMSFVEYILSQIPADQMPAEFDRQAFMEYMRQVQSQIPDEVKQQYMQELNQVNLHN